MFPAVQELMFSWERQTVLQDTCTRMHTHSHRHSHAQREDSSWVTVWFQFQCVWFPTPPSNSRVPGVGWQAQTLRAIVGLLRSSDRIGAVGRHCRNLCREMGRVLCFSKAWWFCEEESVRAEGKAGHQPLMGEGQGDGGLEQGWRRGKRLRKPLD